MNDDWRLRITLKDHGFAHGLGEELRTSDVESELKETYGDRVVVSIDGPEMFLYCGDRAQAQAAEKLVRSLAGEHQWEVETELRHWHPIAEVWEDPDIPLPASDQDAANEADHRNAVERRESAEQGYPEYEVLINLDSRNAAGELADRLRGEGLNVVHRWKHVLAGADDEKTANALADRLRDEAPGAEIEVRLNDRLVYDKLPSSRFAFLAGGL
jgi:hypothetical protein